MQLKKSAIDTSNFKAEAAGGAVNLGAAKSGHAGVGHGRILDVREGRDIVRSCF
jgi:hypothetical protein